MGFNTITLNNINLDDDNFAEDPENINHVRLLALHNRFKQRKTCKKEIIKELMSATSYHPRRRWDSCVSEGEKKRNRIIFD